MTMDLEIVLLVILCIGGCNAGVVSRSFKSNTIEHISIEEKSSTETPRPTQNDILNPFNDTVERNNTFEHFNSASKSVSADFSNISERNSSNFLPNVTHDNETIPDPMNEDSHAESNSTSRNTSENDLKTENAFGASQINETLNDTYFRNESNVTMGISSNILRNENASDINTIQLDINKTISMQNHLVDLNDTFLGHEMKFNDTNNPSLNFLNETDTSTQDLENINISKKFEIPITEKLNETKTSGGMFSGIGLDFLINSQVARNAAKAMEVFNFTDPLTDHIFEENEFHSFLDTKLPTLDVATVNQDPTDVHNNSTEIFGNSTLAGNQTVLQSESDSLNFTIVESELHKRKAMPHELPLTNALLENDTLEMINRTDALSVELFNLTGVIAENETELLHLEEAIAGNETLNLFNRTENETAEFPLEEKTLEQLNNGSVEELPTFKNESLPVVNSTEIRNTSKSSIEKVRNPKCPPPGFCILWFWSQDACELDSHCLGSRICCRVRCSKTCIDVEKL